MQPAWMSSVSPCEHCFSLPAGRPYWPRTPIGYTTPAKTCAGATPPARRSRRRHRPPEQEPLAEAGALVDEVVELVLALDALRQVVDAQAAGEMDDRRRHRRRRLVARHLGDERAVDLQQVHGHPPQARERGVAGAEVVDRHPEAVLVERLEHGLRARRVRHHARLGDLDDHPARVDAGQAGGAQRRCRRTPAATAAAARR